ncbi:MAG: YugN-like family protein [Paenibacillus sp.]|uniref:YugN family protein n=1 Tax=Paenibacillus sp. GCM10012303 TaxID=3317340 RepID=UPI0029EBFFA6|nr:YugN-like family protein [Paenibacillus sp.]
MKPIPSALESRTDHFDHVRDHVQQFQFTLGGNWDYTQGCFDRALDEEHKVWLRLPFEVTRGRLEGAETSNPGTMILMGTPFVLKHIYNEGLDSEAVPRTYGALIDQFQDPVDKDASVEEHWVTQAKELLREVEQGLV